MAEFLLSQDMPIVLGPAVGAQKLAVEVTYNLPEHEDIPVGADPPVGATQPAVEATDPHEHEDMPVVADPPIGAMQLSIEATHPPEHEDDTVVPDPDLLAVAEQPAVGVMNPPGPEVGSSMTCLLVQDQSLTLSGHARPRKSTGWCNTASY
ncbi:uncharacterized protein EDB91DRAFT_704736 [Suillus paluster]|uniref:uncharacterized protein n=1 Tax=Suillus paluster TaxID=48578 RepID=UPI001B880701|nr:uncharacterized protein EDB91DRAFT_704736 [Suillus paluster]KAG1732017.1 hypothetical protein EDB91DRAFT_704736 [Suillus paluster]